MLSDLFKLVIAPILVGGALDTLHQFLHRWLDDKSDDDK